MATHMVLTGPCLTIHGTAILSDIILSDIMLILRQVEMGADSNSDIHDKVGILTDKMFLVRIP